MTAPSSSLLGSDRRLRRRGGGPARRGCCLGDVSEFIEEFAARIYSLAREAGGSIPYTVVREIAENLVHADFREPVASILDDGRTIRFSDQGPGISDKERALLPGFTTASGEAKQYIRGVGSGLPIVQDYVRFNGGSLLIEDNLGSGTVVTIRSGAAPRTAASLRSATVAARDVVSGHDFGCPDGRRGAVAERARPRDDPPSRVVGGPTLTLRQKQVLALVAETRRSGSERGGQGAPRRRVHRLSRSCFARGAGSGRLGRLGRRTVTDEGLRTLETFMAG